MKKSKRGDFRASSEVEKAIYNLVQIKEVESMPFAIKGNAGQIRVQIQIMMKLMKGGRLNER